MTSPYQCLLSWRSYVICRYGFRFSTLPIWRILVLRLDIIDWQAWKCLTICLFIMPAVRIPIPILRLPNAESGRRPIMKKIKFYFGLFVFVHVRISQCKVWWHGVHVECRARDLHDFFNVTWQTVDVRKARKIVMKSEIVLNTTYKTHIKNVHIFDDEKRLDWKKC